MSRNVSKSIIMLICFMLAFGVFFQQKAFVSAASTGALTSSVPNEPISGAAYGNGVYVAVGYYGKILTSANGLDWQIAADKTRLDITYTGVAFGNNVFVAVGYDGTVMTSPDGAVWTQRDSTVTSRIARVAFVTVDNAFYAVTASGTLLKSTDGVTWTSSSVGTSKDLTSIGFNGTAIVIGDSGGYVHTSTNGTSWTQKKIDNTKSFFINSVLGLNNRFYANDPLAGTYTSTDGYTWTPVSITGQVFGGLYDGTGYYLFGSDGTSYGAVFTSTTGTTFTKQAPKTTTMTAQNGFYANGVYMQLGNDGIVVSRNGTAWDYAYGGVVSDVMFDGTTYIAVGKHGNDGFIKTSTDYVNWTSVALSQRVPALKSIASGMGKYIAVSDSPGTMLVSTDGINWSVTSPDVSEYGFTSIAFANAVFVAIGEYGEIYKSANSGTSWTLVRSDLDYNQLWFGTYSGAFYAAGDSGLLLKSTDNGNSWASAAGDVVPSITTFDKRSSNQADIPITFSGTFKSVTSNGTILTLGTDYTVSGTTVTIKKSFLSQLPLGWQTISVHIGTGGTFFRTGVNVTNTAPSLSQVAGVQLNSNGTATWTNVAGAANYEVQLYRNGSIWGSAVSAADGLTGTNILAAMRAAGAGNYTVKVKAIGDTVNYKDGYQSAASGAVTIYKTPTEDGTANKAGTTQRADFNIIVNAQNGPKATAKVGGVNVLQSGTEVPVGSGKATLLIGIDKLTEGDNPIVISLKDASGNFSEDLTVHVTKDTTRPVDAVEDGTADKAGTTQTANFNIIVNAETGASVTAKVGSTNVLQSGASVVAAVGKATLPIDLSKLAEGANSIAIVVTDPVGNVSGTLTVSVTKDTISAANTALAIGYGGSDSSVSVTQALTLPVAGLNGTTVSWSSNVPATIGATGTVTRPAYGAGDATVTLTATISKSGISQTKTFELTVLEQAPTDAQAVAAAKTALEVSYSGTDTAANVTGAVTLPVAGLLGTTVTWSSDDAAVIGATGAVMRPIYGAGDATVTLTATITRGGVSQTKTFTLSVKELPQSDAQAVTAGKAALEVGYGGGETVASVTQDVTLAASGLNGVAISWSSDDAAIDATTGEVTRRSYGFGDATVTLTATITKGAASGTKTFTLTVPQLAQTDAQAVTAAKTVLEVGYGSGETAASVTQAVTLSATGLNGVTISWSSDDVAIDETTGAVTRRSYGLGDATVTLTATITKGAASETKTFTLTVPQLAQTDAQAVTAAKAALEVGYGSGDTFASVTQAVTLSATGQNGVTISWSSDNAAINETTGAVTRPAYGSGDATVTLTATITKNAVTESKTFTLTVLELAQTDLEAVTEAKSALVVGYGGGETAASVTQAVTLAATGLKGTTVTWSSDDAAINAMTGVVTRPAYGSGDATVTLTATITKGTASETKTFTLTVVELAQTDAQAVSAAKSALAITYGAGDTVTNVTQTVTLPASGLNGTTVTWSSDNAAINATTGAVTRPAYGSGDATVTLTATITKGTTSETKTFTLTVMELAQTDAQAVSVAKSALVITYSADDTVTNVTQAVTLPASGLNGTTVTWSSDNAAINATTGAVTRPAYGSGDATVTLTATITKGTASETKTFTLTVMELAQTDAQAVSAAKSALAITYGSGDTVSTVTQAVTLPASGLNGTTVTWSSDNAAINAMTGAVTRPAYGSGNATVTLTATITKGAASDTKTFTLTVIELDNVTPPDTTPPAAPTVNAVDSDDLVITGTAEAGSTVTVKAGGTTLGSAVATGGAFSIALTAALPTATQLEVTATDAANNVSTATLVTVTEATVVTPPDVTPPAAPTVNAVDSDDLVITGTAEAGSTVTVKADGTTLGSAVATGGTFSITLTAALPTATELEVTATDAANNVSTATLVTVTEATVVTPPDVTPPAAPTVNAVDSDDLVITGTAEAGSTVTVKAGGTTLGSAVATGGTFSITLTAALPTATELEVTATDAVSNVSTATRVTVTAALTGTTPTTPSDTTVISTDGTLTLSGGQSGKVSLGDSVTIEIPAGAINTNLKLTIEKVLDTQHLLSDKDVLVSPVFEILKNFSENFSKSITLTFAFDPTKLSGDEKVAVFYYDEVKKEWVKVGGVQINANHVSVEVNHFTKYAVFVVNQKPTDPTPTIKFSDISGHWAEATIKKAVTGGIVNGYQDGTFKPGKTVTRAEFAVMLMNALKPQEAGVKLTFTDHAKIGTWAQNAVAQAVQAGIITGYADGSFRPDAQISRAEMAAMIAKAMGQTTEEVATTGFSDDKAIPTWAKAGVAFVKQAGIVQGKGNNEFAPADHATRAEAVTVLLNMLAQMSK